MRGMFGEFSSAKIVCGSQPDNERQVLDMLSNDRMSSLI